MTGQPPTPPVQPGLGASGYDLKPAEDYTPLGSSSSGGSPASEARSRLEAATISTLECKIAILTKKINIKKNTQGLDAFDCSMTQEEGCLMDQQSLVQTRSLGADTIHSLVI
jgi:hypothetical protein